MLAIGKTIEDIRSLSLRALQSGNEKEYFKILFGSEEKAALYINELQEKTKNVLNKFPMLKRSTEIPEWSDNVENINFFFDNYQDLSKKWSDLNPRKGNGAYPELRSSVGEDTIVCGSYGNQRKFLVCATFCGAATAATGGFASAFCGWRCLCFYCKENSEVARTIC